LLKAGVNPAIVEARNTEIERRELTNKMMEERHLASEAAQNARDARENVYEMTYVPDLAHRGKATNVGWRASSKQWWNATEIAGQTAAAEKYSSEAMEHTIAAESIAQNLQILPAANAPTPVFASGGEAPGRLAGAAPAENSMSDKLDETNALLAQILQHQQQNPPGIKVH
jgi:hypothetical protein